MPRPPEQRTPPEQQLPQYYLASRFNTKQEAASPYFSVQETIRTYEGILNLSAFRFKRLWEDPSDKTWYVLVLGQTPPERIQQRLTEVLQKGEMATVPDQALLEFVDRREEQSKHGSWVEAHYGESGIGIKFSRRSRGKKHRRR
jgi:hypothetical protein